MGSQKKKRKQKKLFRPLITRLTQKGLFSGHKIVLQPSGEIKMSEVLIDFIEPYSEYWETEEELSKLLSLAIVAWNAALFSGTERKEFIERMLKVVPPIVRQDMRAIIEEMMQRKEKHFASNKRMIVSFQLIMTREEPYLSVASILLGI